MSLKSDVNKLLDNICKLCLEIPDGFEVLQQLSELRERLEQPLRVAVVGQIKAGKSTFMNTLMKSLLVCTGTQETTYTVCWFRYGMKPALTIKFRSGEELQTDISEMPKWSVRDNMEINPRIKDVEYLIISYPSEVLKKIEFIDTPGLNSVYKTDSDNTLDFLSIRGSEDTLREAGKADAVIFTFKTTFTEEDKKVLNEFHGKGKNMTSPINSIGIFTRLDEIGWSVKNSKANPVATALPQIQTYRENPLIKNLLFSVLPVCAKPAEGYMQLDEGDWDTLKLLAKAETKKLYQVLADINQFSTRKDNLYDEAIYGMVDARGQLIKKLGAYGIREITDRLREGKTPEEIGDILQEVGGIEDVRRLVSNHFGNRTFLIKTQYIFNQLTKISNAIRSNTDSSRELKNIAEYIREEIDELWGSVQTLKELNLLRQYYDGELDCFTVEEAADLMRVSGEYGRLPEERLDAPKGSTIAELMKAAEEKAEYWNEKVTNGWMFSGRYTNAAAVIARSYELMYYHLNALIEE